MLHSLELYYRELDDTELLSREEEELLYPSLASDSNARKALVEANLKIALKSAKLFRKKNPKYDLNELVAEANLGLAVAIQKFDPSKGFRFNTYAQWWINNRLQQYDLFNHSSVPSPKRVYYKGKNLNYLKGQDTPLNEILDKLECSNDDLEKIEQFTSRSFVPIDKCPEDDFTSPLESATDNIEQQDLLKKVEDLLNDVNVLEEKERLCLTALYGFGSQVKESQAKLAERLNKSTDEIRSIQRNALKQIRSKLV